METKNIMIVGVGGQGTLLTSRVLGAIIRDGGYDVKLSEVHGMAQRGGSVVTYVRYGSDVIETMEKSHKVIKVDAMGEAKKLGNPRVFNTIIIGVAASKMDFEKDKWLKVIEKTVPPKTVDINKKAFLTGYER